MADAPPPPPAPGGRGFPGNLPPGGMRPPPVPVGATPHGHGGGQPGPQQNPQPRRPPIVNSTQIVDLLAKPGGGGLTEDGCRKKLTTYLAYNIRKVQSTWAKASVTKDVLSQEDISKEIKRLSEDKQSILDKKAGLAPNQQGQITKLLDSLNTEEVDVHFELCLVQLDSRIAKIKSGDKKGKFETTVLLVYVKRQVRLSSPAIEVYKALETVKANQFRPPPPQLPPPPPQAPEIIKLPPKQSNKPQRGQRRGRYDDDSSVSSYSSDSASDSDYSSSEATSISSRSGRHPKKHNGRNRSHSRHREHRKHYYVPDNRYSPERRYRDVLPQILHVPEVPRAAAAAPAYDPAYQARDVERYGLGDRYAPPPRPAPELPRTIVTYERPLDRYAERFADRYEDRIYERPLPRERNDRYRDTYRNAEEYIDGRPIERIIIRDPHPFAPRRYAPSSTSSGW